MNLQKLECKNRKFGFFADPVWHPEIPTLVHLCFSVPLIKCICLAFDPILLVIVQRFRPTNLQIRKQQKYFKWYMYQILPEFLYILN